MLYFDFDSNLWNYMCRWCRYELLDYVNDFSRSIGGRVVAIFDSGDNRRYSAYCDDSAL